MPEPPWQEPPAASTWPRLFSAHLGAAKKGMAGARCRPSHSGLRWSKRDRSCQSGKALSNRTSLADLQTQGMNQTAVADEGHYPEAQVDDLAFGKMRAQNIEGLLRGLPMITREYFGKTNSRFFLAGQFTAVFEMR